MNKQQLASKIWESANKMRSKIEAHEYKDYILGFMFYKFLSDKQVKYLRDIDGVTDEEMKDINEEDSEIVKYIQNNLGYFISYDNLFSTWLELGNDFTIDNVRIALSAFDRLISPNYNKVFNRIFSTLQTGLSKLGDSSTSQSKAVRDLIHLIKIIPMIEKQDYDVLGFIYEYLISNFAVNAGKKAGEFYTPQEVSILMSEIVAHHLKERDEIKIYDPTSGSGSLLINIGHSVSKHMKNQNNIKYYAQEIIENTYNLTRMNLIMRGINVSNIEVRNGDTLEEDWPYFDESDPVGTYNPLFVDAVVSNPPYSQKWDRTNRDSDPRYSDFGLAPKSKADYAFLLHDLYHVKPGGIMTIVLPHGVLFRGGEEGVIREKLIEKGHIDAIIGLPANIFFGTGIPTIIMVLKKEKNTSLNSKILFVDGSKNFIKEGNKNKLKTSDIKRIADVVIKKENIDKFSRLVSLEEIRNNEYNLNIPRYVDSSECKESYDLHSLMFGGTPISEIKKLDKYWHVFESLKDELFNSINSNYMSLKVDDITKHTYDNKEVKAFINNFEEKFNNFDSYLNKLLIENVLKLDIPSTEGMIANEIFDRLKEINLVDKYEAFQLFSDEWKNISIDLEIIQSEGLSAVTKVDSKMVIRRDVEVQDGWVGKILPFGIVQQNLLNKELEHIVKLENRILEISSIIEELIDSIDEEDKENVLNNNNDAFDSKKSREMINELKDEGPSELLSILKKYILLADEERRLKREIKQKKTEIDLKTKETIEKLSLEDSLVLLYQKWIKPLIESLNTIPKKIINNFIDEVIKLDNKYDITLEAITKEISDVQKSLVNYLDELVGDEYNMKGIEEFKKLLSGDRNE